MTARSHYLVPEDGRLLRWAQTPKSNFFGLSGIVLHAMNENERICARFCGRRPNYRGGRETIARAMRDDGVSISAVARRLGIRPRDVRELLA